MEFFVPAGPFLLQIRHHEAAPKPITDSPGGAALAAAAAEPEPGDELVGNWSRAQLMKMDACFCAALERAIARGLERRPEQARARAAF